MRQTRAHKEQSKLRIIECAAKAIRTHGLAGASIAPLMAEAGMTHGGFYRHFKSKDELLGIALDQAATKAIEDLLQLDDGSPGDRAREVAARYVSDYHIENVAEGCPLPATGADVSRSSPQVRAAYTQSVRRAITAFAGPESDDKSARARAARELAKVVGAVLIARACDQEGAEEFLGLFRSAD